MAAVPQPAAAAPAEEAEAVPQPVAAAPAEEAEAVPQPVTAAPAEEAEDDWPVLVEAWTTGVQHENVVEMPKKEAEEAAEDHAAVVQVEAPASAAREERPEVPVVHSGTQEFYIGDEGEEEAADPAASPQHQATSIGALPPRAVPVRSRWSDVCEEKMTPEAEVSQSGIADAATSQDAWAWEDYQRPLHRQVVLKKEPLTPPPPPPVRASKQDTSFQQASYQQGGRQAAPSQAKARESSRPEGENHTEPKAWGRPKILQRQAKEESPLPPAPPPPPVTPTPVEKREVPTPPTATSWLGSGEDTKLRILQRPQATPTPPPAPIAAEEEDDDEDEDPAPALRRSWRCARAGKSERVITARYKPEASKQRQPPPPPSTPTRYVVVEEEPQQRSPQLRGKEMEKVDGPHVLQRPQSKVNGHNNHGLNHTTSQRFAKAEKAAVREKNPPLHSSAAAWLAEEAESPAIKKATVLSDAPKNSHTWKPSLRSAFAQRR
eukprot:symbB.v1.2.034460.t2/scaffold4449.1/size39506/1